MSRINRDLLQDDTLRFEIGGYMKKEMVPPDMSRIIFIYAGCLEVNVSTHRHYEVVVQSFSRFCMRARLRGSEAQRR